MVTLEGSPQDISSRLAAIEATVPHLATKADVANMATKDDIANMATKDDIANMATKDDIAAINAKVEAMNAKVEAMNAKIGELQVDIEKGQNSLIRWFIGVALALAAILGPMMLEILNRLS